MKHKFKKSIAAMAMVAVTSTGYAAGELNLFNWGNYTNPELVTKFEKEYDVKVTVTDYDSNDTALSKVKAGGHGYDLVVPSALGTTTCGTSGPGPPIYLAALSRSGTTCS